MFGSNGNSFPVTGLAIVALFLSTAFLGQHGFSLLRQTETDLAQQLEQTEPRVEARLWEDPLAALRRHQDKQSSTCPSSAAPPDAAAVAAAVTGRSSPPCPSMEPTPTGKFKDILSKDSSWTVLAVLVQGGNFVGAGEARRRSRYALLAGLNAAGYVPDDSERIGWLQLPACTKFSGCPAGSGSPSRFDIVYETLSAVVSGKEDTSERRRRVAVLWIDESAVWPRWLTTVTNALNDLGIEHTRLRILGPTTSDALVRVLRDDLPALEAEAKGIVERAELLTKQSNEESVADLSAKTKEVHDTADRFVARWKILTRLQVISSAATASNAQLLAEARLADVPEIKAALKAEARLADVPEIRAALAQRPQPMQEAFKKRFADIRKAFAEGPKVGQWGYLVDQQESFFFRTIGTDDLLIKRLVGELCSRGLDLKARGPSRRVALISEWDSIYARTFATALQDAAKCKTEEDKMVLESYQYLRGLDGMTIDGATRPGSPGGDKARASDKTRDGDGSSSADGKAPPVEWPEGRDQRDYVRRLVEQRLGRNDWRNQDSELQAIGIIGYDVHDKLVLAQALRDAFPDRTIFTTDLDARLLHPGVTQYTRNLIVASSLPLAFEDDKLQCGIAPFRDAYQTALFLGARYAATDQDNHGRGCGGLDGVELKHRIDAELGKTRLFEIGRTGPVELVAARGEAETPEARSQGAARRSYALISAGLLVIIAVLMTLGWPGPAMRAARGLWKPGQDAPNDDRGPVACSARATKIVSGLETASLGFAAAVIVELGAPGSVGFAGALVMAAAAAAFFWLFLYPGTAWVRRMSTRPAAGDTPARRTRRWELVMAQLALFVAVTVGLWMLVVPNVGGDDPHEPFGTFSGVSSWPAELLRTASVVLFAWFLDYAWCASAYQTDHIKWKYFTKAGTATPTARPGAAPGWLSRILATLRDASIWFWRPSQESRENEIVDGAQLWQEYRIRQLGWRRLGRNALWLLVSALFIYLVIEVVGGARPEIPARGIADRTLFSGTLVLSGVMVLILLVLVGDATVLTWRFVTLLKRGRTIYPRGTVRRFALELGPELQTLANRRIEAAVGERTVNGRGGRIARRNSLLDDWIDMRLLGEHTSAVGPLIVFPFILISLMIIARSRLFDNWQAGGGLLIMFAGFVLWSIAVTVLLSFGAERARRKSLERMEADLIWLKGAGEVYAPLADQFSRLIDQVRALRQGAFAPFFEQPSVQALLVPLGGAGGIQLIDYLLFAR